MEIKTVEDVKSNLEELWGRQLAAEFAVKVLIDSHPDRKALAKLWDIAVSHFVDNLMAYPLFQGSPLVQEKALDQLANFRNLLDQPKPK